MTDDVKEMWIGRTQPRLDRFVRDVRSGDRVSVMANFAVQTDCRLLEEFFGLVNPKLIDALLREFREMDRAAVNAFADEVYVPYLSSWREVFESLQRRFPPLRSLPPFRDLLTSMLDRYLGLTLQRSGPEGLVGWDFVAEFDRFTQLKSAFAHIGDEIGVLSSASVPPQAEVRRTRYPKDDEAIHVLREGLRLSGQVRFRDGSDREIMAEVVRGSCAARMRRGKVIGPGGQRKNDACALSPQKAAIQWGKYLSEYRNERLRSHSER